MSVKVGVEVGAGVRLGVGVMLAVAVGVGVKVLVGYGVRLGVGVGKKRVLSADGSAQPQVRRLSRQSRIHVRRRLTMLQLYRFSG